MKELIGALIVIARDLLNLVTNESRLDEHSVRQLRHRMEDVERGIQKIKRRARQEKYISENPGKLECWVGDIATFCEDLVFHAHRVGRDVSGEFNGIVLVATPKSTAAEVREVWAEETHRLSRITFATA